MFKLHKEARINSGIPADQNGLTSFVEVLKEGSIENISVDVNIKNASADNLHLDLVAPNGKSVTLKKGKPGSFGAPSSYSQSFKGESLKPMQGTPSKGRWTLIAKNHANNSQSVLNNWSIDFGCQSKENCPNEVFTKNADKEILNSEQFCKYDGTVGAMKVMVDIDHPNQKNLTVQLLSPTGKTVTLHDKAGNGQFGQNTYESNATKALVGQPAHGTWKLSVNDAEGNSRVGKLRKWKLYMSIKKDDLKKIEGIGPKIEQLLNRDGIETFKMLAEADVSRLKNVLDNAGPRFKMHDPGSWPRQSNLAFNNEWEKLEKLQDELIGGK